jgi:hypothetical protein
MKYEKPGRPILFHAIMQNRYHPVVNNFRIFVTFYVILQSLGAFISASALLLFTIVIVRRIERNTPRF